MSIVNSTALITASTATTSSAAVAPVGIGPAGFPTKVAFVLTVSVTSGTPHVILKGQGSMDNVTWVDLFLIPNDSDTAAASFDKTALGTFVYFVSQNHIKSFPWYRATTTTVTTSTYSVSLAEVT